MPRMLLRASGGVSFQEFNFVRGAQVPKEIRTLLYNKPTRKSCAVDIAGEPARGYPKVWIASTSTHLQRYFNADKNHDVSSQNLSTRTLGAAFNTIGLRAADPGTKRLLSSTPVSLPPVGARFPPPVHVSVGWRAMDVRVKDKQKKGREERRA